MILDKILSMFFCELSDLPFRQRYENMTIVTEEQKKSTLTESMKS